MGSGFFGQLNRLVKDVTQRTSDALMRQQIAMVRGKVAGRPVLDDVGNVLVDSGRTIDDEMIDRVVAAGKMPQLVAAAGAARVQDLREAAKEQIDRTGIGQEGRYLDSVEEYAQARAYVGRYAGVDVTDIRGNVVIPLGKKLTEDDIRTARDQGLLSALVFSAQQPYSPPTPAEPSEPEPRVRGPFESEEPPQPQGRKKVSLVDPSAAGAPRRMDTPSSEP